MYKLQPERLELERIWRGLSWAGPSCEMRSNTLRQDDDGAFGTFLFGMAQHLVTLEVQLRYTAQSVDHESPQVTIRGVLTTDALTGSIIDPVNAHRLYVHRSS